MRTVSAVYFHKGLLSKLALLVKSSQINWNCDKNVVGKNCDIFWNQVCIVQSIFSYRKTSESWQRSSGTTASSFLRQILRQMGPALVHRSCSGCPWYSLCAVLGFAALLGQSPGCARGAELALALLCCVLQSRWRSGAGPPAWAQTTRTSWPRQLCRQRSPSDPKSSLSEGLLALKQFSCAASLQRGEDREWSQTITPTAEELLDFCLPLFFWFASLAHWKAGNNRDTASGFFIKGIVGVF